MPGHPGPERPLRADDVTTFLRELRRSTRHNTEQLEHLAASRLAAANRLAWLREKPTVPDSSDLIDEMTVRDEELRSTTDELREQIESLRRASALLERERSKYIDLFEQAPDAYIVTNMAGVIDEANLAAAALFRAEPSFLGGRTLITFVARQDTRSFRSFLHQLQALDPGRPAGPSRVVLRMRPRGHAVFVVFARVTLVAGDNGQPIALRWVLRQFDLDEAETGNGAAVADLAKALAEDLRGPLVPITAWARSLREGGARDKEEEHLALGWIEKSAEAQQAKLDELAEFASVHSDRSIAGVTDVAEDAQRAVEAEGGTEWSRVALHCHAAPGEARVLGSGLRRAIELFLQRALEGTPRQSTAVEVHVRGLGREALLDIEPPENARIPEGWGVRTATATRIVERCGGRLVLGDTSPLVRIRLPRLAT
jgi:PAS domain-containing protein